MRGGGGRAGGRRRRARRAVAAAGPVAVRIGAPILAALATVGDRALYLLLALATVPAIVLIAPIVGERRRPGTVSKSRSNRVLMGAMWLLTLSGSALFINEALAARDIHGLAPLAASIAFSLNAAGGLIGARFSTRHRHPGWWLASAAVDALFGMDVELIGERSRVGALVLVDAVDGAHLDT